METIIKLKPSELNNSFLDMVKMLVAKKGIKEISISMNDNKPAKRLRKEPPIEVQQKIENALSDINSGNTSHFVSFTAEEFEQFSHSL
jgi:hypothetical protein